VGQSRCDDTEARLVVVAAMMRRRDGSQAGGDLEVPVWTPAVIDLNPITVRFEKMADPLPIAWFGRFVPGWVQMMDSVPC
jgi:hypothetical protein